MCLFGMIYNCTFDLEFCNRFGWLDFGGKKKKEESLLPAQWRFGSGATRCVIYLLK